MPRYIDAEELDNQVKNKKPPYDMNSKAKEGFKTALLSVRSMIHSANNIDVQEANQNQCDMCNGKEASLQDRFSGYKIDIDIKRQELNIWHGDECLANIQIDYCPQCGTKLSKKE